MGKIVLNSFQNEEKIKNNFYTELLTLSNEMENLTKISSFRLGRGYDFGEQNIHIYVTFA